MLALSFMLIAELLVRQKLDSLEVFMIRIVQFLHLMTLYYKLSLVFNQLHQLKVVKASGSQMGFIFQNQQ